MSVLYFANNEITIYRNRRIGSSDRYGISATLTSYPADIQPASIARQQLVEGNFGAVYDAFIDVSVDIKEGDQVIDSSGKRYSVRGTSRWNNAFLLDHKEILLVSLDG